MFVLNLLDFGARNYDPFSCRWTTPDPLAEKYPAISTYAYCANNPVNLLDPEGLQWYSYVDENGETQYVYYEGEMTDEEQRKYNDLKYLGYIFQKDNKYYSLFGKVLDWTSSDGNVPMGQFYNVIDRLIITYATNRVDYEDMSFNKVPLNINNVPNGEYFISYDGRTFSTVIPTGTGVERHNGNRFWNVARDNSWSYIRDFPDTVSPQDVFSKTFWGYWLTAENPNSNGGQGFTTLRLKFSKKDAEAFINSYKKLFKL